MKTKSHRGNSKKLKSKTRKSGGKSKGNSFIKTFITHMFELQLTLKMVHWTTRSYSVHKATDDSMEKLMPLIDNFVETFLGKYKYGKIKQDLIKSVKIKKINTTKELQTFINNNIKYLNTLKNNNSHDENDDLMGIKDDLLSELNILRYLLHLEK